MKLEHERPLNLGDVNGAVAFFVWHLAQNPKAYLKADAQLGGLTLEGVKSENQQLFQAVGPILQRVRGNRTIQDISHHYCSSIAQYDKQGTLSFSLIDSDRQLLLDFLERNGCNLTEWQKKIISTEMHI